MPTLIGQQICNTYQSLLQFPVPFTRVEDGYGQQVSYLPVTASYINVTGSGVLVNWQGDLLQLTASAAAASGLVIIQDSPPPTMDAFGAPVTTGSLWWDSTSGSLYVYYPTISSSQWVQTNASLTADPASGYLLTASAVPQTLNSDILYNGVFSGSAASVIMTEGTIHVTNTGTISNNGYYVMENYLILNFADDIEAAAAGVPLGGFYRTGNMVVVRLS